MHRKTNADFALMSMFSVIVKCVCYPKLRFHPLSLSRLGIVQAILGSALAASSIRCKGCLTARVCLGCFFQFRIPRLSEAADEGFAEETVKGKLEFLAFAYGGLADVPTVIVEPREASQLLLPNGVKGATDGLGMSFAFEGAEAAAVPVTGEDAIPSVHDACHEVSFTVDAAYSVEVYLCLCLCAEVVPHGGEGVLEGGYLVHRDGCSCIALYATCAAACLKVAAETFGEDVGMENDISHDEQVTKGWVRFHER